MLLTAIVFIILLSVLVLVHEFGHFYTARKLGVKVEEFGIGFPPKALGIKSKKTGITYSINWLPLGGFVKIKGEDGEHRDDQDSFSHQKIWKRIVIISAGVFMNFVLACVLLGIAFTIGAPAVIDDGLDNARIKDQKVQIYEVLENSPAKEVGLKAGDAVIRVDNVEVTQPADLSDYVKTKDNQEVKLIVKRLNEEMEFVATPQFIDELQAAGLGVSVVKTGIVSYPWYKSIWLGVKTGVLMTGSIIKGFGIVIKNLVTTGKAGFEVAGPVGIAVLTGQMTKLGINYLINFAAILSLNLMIINFLPFPALDGGRVLFLIIEKLRGKPIKPKIENLIHTIGFALLILLVIIVTGRDIFKFKDIFGNIWDKIVS
ncbi:MAG: RIP metalloprotease RseP [Patescibacteria group bacterium]